MKIIKKVLILFLVIPIMSCETMINVWLDSGKSNARQYDELKCERGPASSPGITRRVGCVNAYTENENKNEYKRYQKELEQHKEQLESEVN